MVIGIEMNESAVLDAHRNAQINGIKNCKFVCGKAEDVIGAVLKEYLNVPQQHDDASDILGSKGIVKDANESNNENMNVSENLDGDATVDSTQENGNNDSVEFSENLDGENIVDSNKENGSNENLEVSRNLDGESTVDSNNDSLVDESSNHKTNDTCTPAIFPKTCTTECRLTSQENQECRVENQDILKEADENKENAECRNTHDNGSFEEKETKTAPVCQFKDVVAIVDPPRSGLHPIVIKALRTHPRIRRLVYISCNPETLVANAIELCTPTSDKSEKVNKGNRGWRRMSSAGLARQRTKSMPVSEPFRPVKAMAVDLFPHTTHCEMVMLLER